MSKYLSKVIKEMNDYGKMGMPDGEGSMGMGTPSLGMRGNRSGKAVKAYKLNDVLRYRNRAEEEEDIDMEMDSMDDYESDETGDGEFDEMGDGDTEELQQFFMDNPEPSDEEIAMYADEKGMDLQDMRKAVYALIQSLLPDDEEGMDDEMDDEFADETGDEMDFSVSGDTGERPASNEFEERRYGRRLADRKRFK